MKEDKEMVSNSFNVNLYRSKNWRTIRIKKKDVNLEEQYFDVTKSKTDSGVRKSSYC